MYELQLSYSALVELLNSYCYFLRCSKIPAILATGVANPVLILDNCRIHHPVAVQAELVAHGIEVIYLPAYSPKLNPIEQSFSKTKAFIRHHGKLYSEAGLNEYRLMNDAFASITAEDAVGWITHSGY